MNYFLHSYSSTNQEKNKDRSTLNSVPKSIVLICDDEMLILSVARRITFKIHVHKRMINEKKRIQIFKLKHQEESIKRGKRMIQTLERI